MPTCSIFSLTINGDKSGRIARLINNTEGLSVKDKQVLAGSINEDGASGAFVEWLVANDETLAAGFNIFTDKYDGNRLKSKFKTYIQITHPSVSRMSSSTQLDTKNGFLTTTAKKEALQHTADVLREKYITNLTKQDKKQTLKEAYEDAIAEMRKEARNQAKIIYEQTNVENKDLAKRIKLAKDLEKLYSERKTELNPKIEKLNTLIEKYTDNKDKLNSIKDENTKIKFNNALNSLKKQIKELKIEIAPIDAEVKSLRGQWFDSLYNLLEYGNEQQHNFLALVKNINSTTWLNDAILSSGIYELKQIFDKEFGQLAKSDAQVITESDNIDSELNFDDEDSIDNMAKEWEHSQPSSWTKQFSSGIKMYLGSFYQLEEPIKDEQEPMYSYNTSLGTKISIPYQVVINQLMAHASFGSVYDFIQSVERLSQTNPSLYGLSQMVKNMKDDITFARLIFTELKQPIINKCIAYIAEQNRFDQNNKDNNSSVNLYFNLRNNFLSTYIDSYNPYDENKITELAASAKEMINKPKLVLEKIWSNNKFIIPITDYLTKFFPGIDIKSIKRSLYNMSLIDRAKKVNEILNAISKFNAGVTTTFESKQKENTRFASEMSKYNKLIEELADSSIHIEKPIYNNSNITTTAAEAGLFDITKAIKDLIPTTANLNAQNAKGNSSSNLLRNNWLTNFIEQIRYTEIDKNGYLSNKGIELLKQYITKDADANGNPKYYRYSNILFGINDGSKQIVKGLFTKDRAGIKANMDIINAFDIALFDGVRSVAEQDGTVYQQMAKPDYFLANMYAFKAAINYKSNSNPEILKDSNSKQNNFTNIFMRIPSDASNIFTVQMPIIPTNNIFITDEAGLNSDIFNKYLANLSDKVNQELIKDKLLNKISKTELLTKDNAKLFLNIIKNNGIKEEFNFPFSKAIKQGKDYYIPFGIDMGETQDRVVIYLKAKKVGDATGKTRNIFKEATISSIVSDNKVNPLDIILNYLVRQPESYTLLQSEFPNRTSYNFSSAVHIGLRNNVLGELQNFITQVMNVFDDKFNLKTNTKNLYDTYHLGKDGKLIKKVNNHLELAGRAFTFGKLFNINGIDYGRKIIESLSLYGEGANNQTINNPLFIEENGTLHINPNHSLIKFVQTNKDNKTLIFDEQKVNEIINPIIQEWVKAYDNYIQTQSQEFIDILPADINQDTIKAAIYNMTLDYMSFDDMFEGSDKFYKDAQTFLKRAKETQMGGKVFSGFDFGKEIGGEITEITDRNGNKEEILLTNDKGEKVSISRNLMTPNGLTKVDKTYAQNGFRAVTIYNTINSYDKVEEQRKQIYRERIRRSIANRAKELYLDKTAEEIYKMSIEEFNEYYKSLNNKYINAAKSQIEKEANATAEYITKGYEAVAKVNDAQSFITLDEFIRRRYYDGTLNDYKDLLWKLIDENYELTGDELNEINARIQPQKNVYYDIAYDSVNQVYYPRQIKNAEFVIIPKLLPKGSDLDYIYRLMVDNDIAQLNTKETSKAANKNVLTLWDNNGNLQLDSFTEAIKDNTNVENYYYRNLYKQQNVIDHIVDEENKAGIQIMKKIQDNLNSGNPSVKKSVNNLQTAFSANIKNSFNQLLFNIGLEFVDNKIQNRFYKTTDENGNPLTTSQIEFNKYNINFKDFYRRARVEAERLGMDSNFIEYITPNEDGSVDMPNFMNNVASKLESIAQAMFNKSITRQTLPGWHAAQVTGVGYSNKLQYRPTTYNEDGTVKETGYMEVYLPRWSKLIPQWTKDNAEGLSKEEFDKRLLAKMESEGLDIHIGYRIPTEGKQSISVLKVKGFVDSAYGSTIIVADEWVRQTGSDFDIDTIYGISYEMYKDLEGNLHKIEYKEPANEAEWAKGYIAYIKDILNNSKSDEKNIIKAKETAKGPFINDKGKPSLLVQLKAFNKLSKEIHLPSFNEYQNLPIEERMTTAERNNYILDQMVNIMQDVSSYEENQARSNFDDITEAKSELEDIIGVSAKSYSSYNPFDQFRFMQNAIDGKQLKAASVNRDTFNSVNNILRTQIKHGIIVDYKLGEDYDLATIKEAYGDKVEVYEKNGITYARVYHNRLGHSLNDRNIIGRYVTVYSSETTAHILDAIKEGAIYNESMFTFSTFKTLVDLGIDYKTAIAFLMQPAITAINVENNKLLSQFVKNYGNAIDLGIKSIITKYNAIPLQGRESLTTIINTLSKDSKFINTFEKVFDTKINVDKNGNSNLFEFKANIERESLVNNLKSEHNTYEDFVYDLGIALTFRNYYYLSQSIDAIAKCTRPDSYGARQTIRSTRAILEDIENYTNNDKNPTTNELFGIDDNGNEVPILKLLYPDYKYTEDGINLNTEKSKYKYLANILKYSTATSVSVNQNLFLTESKDFNDITKNVQQLIGRSFTDEQYNIYKRYLVSMLYNNIPVLSTPITINKNGFFVQDETRIADEVNESLEYWNAEKGRIYGFIEKENDRIEDTIEVPEGKDKELYRNEIINLPVKELLVNHSDFINRYNRLTPAQKVLFIKRMFNYDAGLFEIVNVQKFNQTEVNNKGYSKNRITIKTDNYNIEDIFKLFNEAFFNKNYFVRMAAADLVKYAFIVEGFNFTYNGISKVIPNSILKADINNNGLGLISSITDEKQNLIMSVNDRFKDLLKYNDNFRQNYVDKFVRSHSDLIRTYRFPKPSTEGQTMNLGNKLNNCILSDDSIYIPLTESYQDLLEQIRLTADSTEGYVKLQYYTGKKRNHNLYKIVRNDKLQGIYLIPLNELEANETSDYSINNGNNRFRPYDYYKDIVTNKINSQLTLDDVKQIVKSESDKTTKIPTYKFKNVKQDINSDYLQVMADNFIDTSIKGKLIHDAASKFVNDATKWYINYGKRADVEYGLVYNTSEQLNRILNLKENGAVFQDIYINDQKVTIKITPYSVTRINNKIYKKWNVETNKKGKYSPLNTSEQIFYDNEIDGNKYFETNTNRDRSIYKIEFIADEAIIKQEADEIRRRNEEKVEFEASVFDDLDIDIPTGTTAEITDEQRLPLLIANDIKYSINRGNTYNGLYDSNLFLSKGIRLDSIKEVNEHKKDIYYIANRYYERKANELLANVSNFTLSNGNTYSISDPNLYKELNKEENKGDFDRLIKLLLELRTFGENIYSNIGAYLTSDDADTAKALTKLSKTIDRIKGDSEIIAKINKAYDNVFNIFLADNYSTNPNVQLGLVTLTDVYGDSGFGAHWIGDIHDINHKQIQVVTKMVERVLKTEEIKGQRMVAEYKKKIEEIKSKGNVDYNKIINEYGQFVQDYTDKFKEDKVKYQKELDELRATKGETSIEYLRKKLEFDKWKLKNTNQRLPDDYYRKDIQLREEVLAKVGDKFAEYLTLRQKLYALYNDSKNLTKEQQEELINLRRQVANLSNPNRVFNNTEDTDIIFTDDRFVIQNESEQKKQYNIALAIKEYTDKKKALNKQYFEDVISEDFKENLKYNLNVVENYNKEHPYDSEEVKLQNIKYAASVEWLRDNATFVPNEEASDKINKAFKVLQRNSNRLNGRKLKKLLQDIKDKKTTNLYDVFGTIDGTKFTNEEKSQIRDIILEQYKPFGYIDENGNYDNSKGFNRPDNELAYSDAGLIKDVDEQPIYNYRFYRDLNFIPKGTDGIIKKQELYTRINNILYKCINKDTGRIDFDILYKNLSQAEIQDLAQYYQELRDLYSEDKDSLPVEESDSEKLVTTFAKTDNKKFMESYAKAIRLGGNALAVFKMIFCEPNQNGFVLQDKSKNKQTAGYIPNKFIYGYFSLTKKKGDPFKVADADEIVNVKKYINKEATEARELLNSNVEFINTDHYYTELQNVLNKAKEIEESQGKEAADKYYDDWFNLNHTYNPYQRKWEALPIWTKLSYKEDGTLKGQYEWKPRENNIEHTPKQINPNYKENSYNYRTDTGSYNNPNVPALNDAEKEMRNYLLGIMTQFSLNKQSQRFIKEGNAPRLYNPKIDAKWYGSQLAQAAGLKFRNYSDRTWHEDISYAKDFEPKFDMLQELKAKGYKQLIKVRPKLTSETDAEYKKYIDDVTSKNNEIRKENKELEKSVLNTDWENVFKQFIFNANQYDARAKVKNLMYLQLEDLKHRNALKVSPFGNLVKDKNFNVSDDTKYLEISQKGTIDAFETYMKRVLFGEYKKLNPLTKYADFLQNITSAKYMIFNIYGGITNVATGLVNILGEQFAKEYFGTAEFTKAAGFYSANALGMMNDALSNTDKPSNMASALARFFNVVNIDEMLEFGRGDFTSASENAQRVQNILYSMQSGGEHFMQNTVLFAVLNSHRLITNSDGKVEAMSIADYTRNLDELALRKVIDGNQVLIDRYNDFKKYIRQDKNIAMKYNNFQRDLPTEFIKSLATKEQQQEITKKYVSMRDEFRKNAKEEFDKATTIMNQLDYDSKTGMINIKPDSLLTDEMCGFLSTKAIEINKKIHGFYDKNAAAVIERYWWGSLVMQYHKHIYPGIMKRYRTKGYYNEIRGTREYGSYAAFWNYLTTDFNNYKQKARALHTKNTGDISFNDSDITALESIQTTAICALDCINNLKINWELLPTWQQQNIKRALADIVGITASLLLTMGIYAMADDDDIKEDIFINSLLYLADREYSESRMYTPFGLGSELSTMMSSPVAMTNTVEDCIKLIGFVISDITDEDWSPVYTSGVYANQNKYAVTVLRNIPAIRVIRRISTIDKNNNYYRINSNAFASKAAKNIGKSIGNKD